MATIGSFNREGDEFTGSLETLTMRARITLSPAQKNSDNAPDYRVFHQTDAFASEIGAAWKKASKEGGAEYFSGTLDDPSFAERINFRLVKTGSEHGYTMYWDRPRNRD